MKKVIVCEDYVTTLNMYQEILQEGSFSNEVFYSGKKVIEYISKNIEKIYIVITDLDTPDMDGLELSRAIDNLYPSIPVIIVSSTPKDQRCQLALKLSCVVGVEDKFEMLKKDRLIETIENYLYRLKIPK